VDFLPEFSTVDLTSESTLRPRASSGKKKGHPPAVHVHHKFIVIDAETDSPTIYTGSNNLSNNSTHNNDESLLEITGSPELTHTYLTEFMRLYEHYRARAIWNQNHGKGAKPAKSGPTAKTLTLAKTRDGWVKGAYRKRTPEFIARTKLAS
jgi:phosphatidylserine/phosphatidylglycerophosphate/cardiolipin synthase-like enzyme